MEFESPRDSNAFPDVLNFLHGNRTRLKHSVFLTECSR